MCLLHFYPLISPGGWGKKRIDRISPGHCLDVTHWGQKYSGVVHTTYSKNNMGHKCEGNRGLWVLNEIIKRIYPENLKKIVDAVWELCTC